MERDLAFYEQQLPKVKERPAKGDETAKVWLPKLEGLIHELRSHPDTPSPGSANDTLSRAEAAQAIYKKSQEEELETSRRNEDTVRRATRGRDEGYEANVKNILRAPAYGRGFIPFPLPPKKGSMVFPEGTAEQLSKTSNFEDQGIRDAAQSEMDKRQLDRLALNVGAGTLAGIGTTAALARLGVGAARMASMPVQTGIDAVSAGAGGAAEAAAHGEPILDNAAISALLAIPASVGLHGAAAGMRAIRKGFRNPRSFGSRADALNTAEAAVGPDGKPLFETKALSGIGPTGEGSPPLTDFAVNRSAREIAEEAVIPRVKQLDDEATAFYNDMFNDTGDNRAAIEAFASKLEELAKKREVRGAEGTRERANLARRRMKEPMSEPVPREPAKEPPLNWSGVGEGATAIRARTAKEEARLARLAREEARSAKERKAWLAKEQAWSDKQAIADERFAYTPESGGAEYARDARGLRELLAKNPEARYTNDQVEDIIDNFQKGGTALKGSPERRAREQIAKKFRLTRESHMTEAADAHRKKVVDVRQAKEASGYPLDKRVNEVTGEVDELGDTMLGPDGKVVKDPKITDAVTRRILQLEPRSGMAQDDLLEEIVNSTEGGADRLARFRAHAAATGLRMQAPSAGLTPTVMGSMGSAAAGASVKPRLYARTPDMLNIDALLRHLASASDKAARAQALVTSGVLKPYELEILMKSMEDSQESAPAGD